MKKINRMILLFFFLIQNKVNSQDIKFEEPIGPERKWVEYIQGKEKNEVNKYVYVIGYGESRYDFIAKQTSELNAAREMAAAIRTKILIRDDYQEASFSKIVVSGMEKVGVYWRQMFFPIIKERKQIGWSYPVYGYYSRYRYLYTRYQKKVREDYYQGEKEVSVSRKMAGLYAQLSAHVKPSRNQFEKSSVTRSFGPVWRSDGTILISGKNKKNHLLITSYGEGKYRDTAYGNVQLQAAVQVQKKIKQLALEALYSTYKKSGKNQQKQLIILMNELQKNSQIKIFNFLNQKNWSGYSKDSAQYGAFRQSIIPEEWLIKSTVLYLKTLVAQANFSQEIKATTKEWFEQAIRYDSVKIVKELNLQDKRIQKATIRENLTPLMLAASRNSCKVLRYLLANGAEVDSEDQAKNTALHHAILEDSIEAALILLDSQASVTKENTNGETPFLLSLKRNDVELIAKMIPVGVFFWVEQNNIGIEMQKEFFSFLRKAVLSGSTYKNANGRCSVQVSASLLDEIKAKIQGANEPKVAEENADTEELQDFKKELVGNWQISYLGEQTNKVYIYSSKLELSFNENGKFNWHYFYSGTPRDKSGQFKVIRGDNGKKILVMKTDFNDEIKGEVKINNNQLYLKFEDTEFLPAPLKREEGENQVYKKEGDSPAKPSVSSGPIELEIIGRWQAKT